MPIAKVQLPDGRIAKFQVPEGTTQAQVEEFAKGKVQGQKPVSAYDRRTPAMKQLWERMGKLPYEAGAEMTDIAAGTQVLPPQVSGALGAGVNALTEAIPSLLGGELTAGAKPAVKKTAEWLMQSALKPTTEDLVSGKAGRATQTMLKEGLPVSGGTLQKLRAEIDKLDAEVTAAIKRSPATVDKQKVLDEMRGVFDRFSNRLTSAERTGHIKEAIDEFMNHPFIKLAQGDAIPIQQAQDLKRGIYAGLGEKAFGPQAIPAASKEAQKGLARGLRKGIEEQVPEVAAPNQRMSELINAANVSTRQALAAPNRNPGGLGWMAHSPLTFAAFETERSPFIKSLIANSLYRNQEVIPRGVGQIGGAMAGGYGGLAPSTMHNLGVTSPVPIPQKEPTAQEIDQNWAKYMQPIVEDQKKMKEYQKQQQEKQQHQFDWMQGVRG